MNDDISAKLAEAKLEHDKLVQAADAKFIKDKADLLEKVTAQFASKLSFALTILKPLPEDLRANVFADVTIRKIFESYGIKQVKSNNGRKGNAAPGTRMLGKRKPKPTHEQVLGYLGDGEKGVSEIVTHFGSTNVTMGVILKEMDAAHKIQSRKDGTSKFWKKV